MKSISQKAALIHKEASRLMWIFKGQLIPEGYSDQDILDMHDDFFYRLWGNVERIVYAQEGFEEAYREKYG